MQWNLKKDLSCICKKEAFVDLPCYTSPAVQDDFGKKIQEICKKWKMKQKSSAEDMEIVKMLAPLTENLNADVQDDFRKKIWQNCQKRESSDEDTDIVKILAPLIDNPNALDSVGRTPAYLAGLNGHTEIVKILAIP